MKSFRIDGVLFMSSDIAYNSNYKRNFINYDLQNLYIIVPEGKNYVICSVNYIRWSSKTKLRFDCNKLWLDGQVSPGYYCSRNDIVYYSSDLKLILKKIQNLRLLS